MRSHKLSFTIAIGCIGRMLDLRDRVLGWMPSSRSADSSTVSTTRHSIRSGGNLLDAVFAEPAARPAQAALLICHGIGETVQTWLPVQQLLAANGVASLVFDYSGYGRSTGAVGWAQCELDALSALQYLQSLTVPLPVSILGFSLGSGPAIAIVNSVSVDRLVLCSAFTSFRAAVRAVGLPASLSFLVPPIWSAEESLRECRIPVLVVHGEKDRLFPVQMASDLVSWCPGQAELLVVPNIAHNQPFRRPDLSYWGLIISRLIPAESTSIQS